MRKNVKLSMVLSSVSLALSMMYSTVAISYVNAVLLSSYPFQYLAYFYLSSALLYIVITNLSASYFALYFKQTLTTTLVLNIAVLAIAWLWRDHVALWVGFPFILCVFLLANAKFLIQIYWNMAAQLLQIRDFKNISNILGAAIAIGGIGMGLLGPIIIEKYGIIGLLPVIGVFLLINLGLLFYSSPVGLVSLDSFTVKAISERSNQQYNLSRLLIYFALMTIIFSTLVDYVFKYQMGTSFGTEKIAIYTSQLFALSYVIAFLTEIFYIKKILQRFGLFLFIVQVPVFFIFLTLLLVFKANLMTISVLWVAYNVMNLSILDLSFQLLGNALPEQIRGASKLRAKGVGLLFGSLISSGLIFFLSNKTSVTAICLCLLLAMILFIFLVKRIINAYDKSLERNLKEHHILNFEALSFTDNEAQWNETVRNCFDSKDAAVKLMGYELLEKKPLIVSEILDKVSLDLNDMHPHVRVEAAKVLSAHMNEKYFIELNKRLEVETEAEVIWWIFQGFLSSRKEDALGVAQQYLNSKVELIQAGRVSILIKFGNIMDVIMALNRLVRMIHSPDPMLRMMATRILSLFDLQGAIDSLSTLMMDPDIHVSMMAIQAAIEHPRKEYIPSLIHQMGVKNVTYYAYKAGLYFGVDIIPNLVAQINSVKNPIFHRTAIRCIASIEGEVAEKALVQLLAHENTLVRNNTVKAIAYRALTMEFTEEFLQTLKNKLQDEKNGITYYKQLLKLELTLFENQEIKALLYSSVYRVLYLFSIDAPQKLIPIISLILFAIVQSDFSHFFQEKIELLDNYLRDSHDRLFLLQLFDESKIAVIDRASLLSADKLSPWLATVFSIQFLTHEGDHMHDLEKLVILRGCDLFKNLPADLLLLLAERLEVMLMPKDTVLFKEGELSGDLYIVAEGDVRIMHETQLISHKKKFDFIGELSILDDKPRTATAVAETEVVVLKMNKIEYDRILDDFPDILRTIAQTLLGYLRQYQS